MLAASRRPSYFSTPFFPLSLLFSLSSLSLSLSLFLFLSVAVEKNTFVLLSGVTIILEEITDTQSVAGCAVNFSRSAGRSFRGKMKIHTMVQGTVAHKICEKTTKIFHKNLQFLTIRVTSLNNGLEDFISI